MKKLRDVSLIFWLGLFFMTSKPVFLWFVLISYVILTPSETRQVKDQGSSLWQQIKEDAGAYDLRLPKKPFLRSLLKRLYQKYNQSVEAYPHLQSEYRELLEEMWQNLKLAGPDSQRWETMISKLVSDWPSPKATVSQNVESSLGRVTRLTRQWEEARQEA